MFTGIINHIGHIHLARKKGDLVLSIRCDWPEDSFVIGESIACNGVCLTVTDKAALPSGESSFTVAVSEGTLRCTPPCWETGQPLHLERALRMGDALDGHLVTGHVDGQAVLLSIEPVGDSHVLELEVTDSLSHFIAEKGSVTIDGISLTVNKVEGNRFWVNIIPHTWEMTTLNQRRVRDSMNIEIDMIARYVARLLKQG